MKDAMQKDAQIGRQREQLMEHIKRWIVEHNNQEPDLIFLPVGLLEMVTVEGGCCYGIQRHPQDFECGDQIQVMGMTAIIYPGAKPMLYKRTNPVIRNSESTPMPLFVGAAKGPNIVEHTIEGGLTNDTLCDAYGLMGSVLAVHAICNNVTATQLEKFRGPFFERGELLHKLSTTALIDGCPWFITRDRAAIQDDQIRFLGSDGNLYVFNFV